MLGSIRRDKTWSLPTGVYDFVDPGTMFANKVKCYNKDIEQVILGSEEVRIICYCRKIGRDLRCWHLTN